MKKSYSFSILVYLFTIIALLVFASSMAQSQVQKRVLLEEFTGEWCGWCPDGAAVMKTLVDKYPNTLIAAAHHEGDWLQSDVQATLTSTLGILGYPSGYVDRMVFNVGGNNTITLDRGAWESAYQAAVAVPADVDVKLYYQWNASSRVLKMTITGTFQKDMSGDFRFNAYILENNIAAHSQNNGGSNYIHQHVVRKTMGDAWGTAGIIPASVKSGDKYSTTYSYTLPSDWVWNNIVVVGFVQKYNANIGLRQIMNCVEGIAGTPELEFTKASGADVQASALGQTSTNDFSIKNLTNGQMTYQITIAKSARTPSDWNVALQLPSGATKATHDKVLVDELTINSGDTKTVSLKLTPGTTIGIGDATINIRQKTNPTGDEGNGSLTVASAEMDKFQVIDDNQNGTFSMASTILNSGATGYYDIYSSEFAPIYTQFNKINDVIWTCGTEGTIDNSKAATIKGLIDDGIPLLISGSLVVFSIDNASPNLFYSIGCSYGGKCWQGETTGLNINLIGYANDPITNGFDRAITVSNYFTQGIVVNNPKTYPILKHKYVDTVVAVRSELPSARVVLIGINPMYITNTSARYSLIGNAIKWLNNLGPKISSTATVDFGDVSTQSDLSFAIRNSGEDPLTVTKMEVDFESSNVFLIQSPSTPFTIQPGDSQLVTIRFKPQGAFQYQTNFTITSNAVNNATYVVVLKGTGVAPGNGPKIESDVDTVSFGDVPINKPDDLNIVLTNSGQKNLVINSANIVSSNSGIFVVTSPATFPVTVAPTNTTNITVRFSPNQKIDYTGTLNIVSNAENNATLSIPLTGKGDNPVGVKDGDCNCPLNLSAAPNPFDGRTTISYNVGGNGGFVNITVIDERGTQVATLVNKTLGNGTYTQEFQSKGLSSGMYIIIAKINGKTAQLPIIIDK